MKKIPRDIQYTSIGLSLVIIALLNFQYKLIHTIWNVLESICDCYMAISTNIFDFLIFSSIPIFGMLLTTKRERFTTTGLIYDNLIIIGSVLMTMLLAIYLLMTFGKRTNPLFPESMLFEPFDSFSVLTVGIGLVIPFLLTIKRK